MNDRSILRKLFTHTGFSNLVVVYGVLLCGLSHSSNTVVVDSTLALPSYAS